MLKILIYSPLSLRFGGGVEHWVFEVAPRLSKLGHEVSVITTRFSSNFERVSIDEITKKATNGNFEYLELPYIKIPRGGAISLPKFLMESAKESSIIYFINAVALQDTIMSFVKNMTRTPVVSAIHAPVFYGNELHNLYVKTIGKTLLKRFDAHHVLNSNDRELLSLWGLKKVYQIPDGVDVEKFRFVRKKEKGNEFKVLFVGRLVFQKGIDILHNAITYLNKDARIRRNVKFCIVGSGPMRPLIDRLTRRFENVKSLGYIHEEGLPSIYASSDLFVMPTRWETFPLPPLEAQASGLPVIISDIPGPRDQIVNGMTGFLIYPEEPVSLALAIRRVYDLYVRDQEKYWQMCLLARKNAVENFDWNILIKRLESMLIRVAHPYIAKKNNCFMEQYNERIGNQKALP